MLVSLIPASYVFVFMLHVAENELWITVHSEVVPRFDVCLYFKPQKIYTEIIFFLNRSLFQSFFSFIPLPAFWKTILVPQPEAWEPFLLSLSFSDSHIRLVPVCTYCKAQSRLCVSTFFKCCPLPENYSSRRSQYNLAFWWEGLEFSLQNFRHLERPNTCRVECNHEQLSNEFGPS